eukprot:Pgem_evm1s14420
MGKVLLLQANLDDSFWAEAFDAASTILTICNGSYAKKHNVNVNLQDLEIFGSKVLYRKIKVLNYFNSSSPVISRDSTRAVIAATTTSNLKEVFYDFSNSYANADLDVKMNLRIPTGYAEYSGLNEELRGKILELKKALYGTKQAGALWHYHIREYLIKNGFSQLPNDPC